MTHFFPEDVKEAQSNQENNFSHYVLISELGQGGMGKIYKAYDIVLNRYVALKFLQPSSDEIKDRFMREAQILAKLVHSNVAQVYELNEHDGKLYMAIQYIDGVPLDEAKLSINEVLEKICAVADGISVAHENGIIHRDIKPANILIDNNGNSFITDFGIAKFTRATKGTHTKNIIGTPNFMPPEQARGDNHLIDEYSDVYALGSTLYATLTRILPFDAEDTYELLKKVVEEDPIAPRRLNPLIPADVETIILKAMQKEKRHRYQTIKEIKEDIKRYLDGEPVLARRPDLIYGAFKKLKKHKFAVATVFTLIFAVIAVLWVVISEGRKRDLYKNQTQMLDLAAEKIDSFESSFYLFEHPINNDLPQLDEAEKLCNEIIEKCYDIELKARAYYLFARSQFLRQELDSALESIKKAVDFNPRPTHTLLAVHIFINKILLELELTSFLGKQEPKMGKPEFLGWVYQTKKDVDKICRQEPMATEYFHFFQACIQTTDENELDKMQDNLIRLGRQHNLKLEPDIWRLRGYVSAAHKNFDKTITCYKRALEIRRSDYNIMCWLAGAYFRKWHEVKKQDLLSNTHDLLNRAIRVNPDYFLSYFIKGTIYLDVLIRDEHFIKRTIDPKKLGESIECLKKALSLKKHKVIFSHLGTVYMTLGNFMRHSGQDSRPAFEEAIFYFTQAVKIDLSYVTPLTSRAAITLELLELSDDNFQQKIQQVIEDMNRVIKKSPQMIGKWFNLRGRAKALLAFYLHKQNQDPKDAIDEALHDMNQAELLGPNDDLYHRLSWIHLLKGYYETGKERYDLLQLSIKYATKFLDFRGDNSQAYDIRGRAHYLLGDFLNAQKDLQKALELNPALSNDSEFMQILKSAMQDTEY